jgi:oxygen-dependent protoporphyrinogen oxidase
MRIAVAGGGIAGLAAAFELEKIRRNRAGLEYALFEAGGRLGGSLASDIVAGAVLERGPDSFLTEKAAAIELCRELGLGDQLVPSNDAARKTYIVVRNRLVALPDGLMFLVPTKLLPTAFSPLFSFGTKARMAMELLHPPTPNGYKDESVAALVERHYGYEMVDRLADPLLAGIYGGDAAQLSARAVLPRLVEMETQYGSLTRGMLALHRQARRRPPPSAAAGDGTGSARSARPALFTALRGGMQQLVDALTARLDPASVHLSTPILAIERDSDGWRVDAGGFVSIYDAVILALPAWAAAELLGGVDAQLSEELAAIPYSSSITVNLIYEEAGMRLPEGFGFLVPPSENRSMLACTFAHHKFLGRTPPGKAVFRAFLGGMKNEALLAEPDSALVAIVRRELREILGDELFGTVTEPDHVQVSRWRRAMAQYAVGHKERAQRIGARVKSLPNLRLAGNAYDGIGVPDCIRLGRQAARELTADAAAAPPTAPPVSSAVS